MKVVVNRCFGGFGLSNKAIKMLASLKGKECYFYKQVGYSWDNDDDENLYIKVDEKERDSFISTVNKDYGEKTNSFNKEDYDLGFDKYSYGKEFRIDKDLIKVIETLGNEADGNYASLDIVEIPNDIEWEINEYDGSETIEEVHRSW